MKKKKKKNHQSLPTEYIPLPKANATIQVNRRRRGHGYYGQGRGRGHGRYNSWNRGNYNQSQNKNNTSNNQKLNRSEKLSGKATGLPHNKKVYETKCYRCRMKGHWSRTCQTAKHLVDLYQASMKGKDKKIETNFIDGKDTMDPDDPFFDDDGAVPLKHFDVSDFLKTQVEKLTI